MTSSAELWAELERLRAEGAYPFLCGQAWSRWFEAAIAEGRDPSRLRRDAPSLAERIDAYTIPGLDGCLIWDGKMSIYNQPTVQGPRKDGGGTNAVHVRNWLLRQAGREIPVQRKTIPLCGTNRCVRLEHLGFSESGWMRKTSISQLLNLLRAYAAEKGRSPSMDEWDGDGRRPTAGWIGKTFGGWSKALEKAGLEPRPASVMNLNARKTHCDHGHPLSGENLKIAKNGSRICRTCRTEADRRWHKKRRAEREAGTWTSSHNSTKTHCKRGHPLSGENLRIDTVGKRVCRACTRERARRSHRNGSTP